MFDVLFCTVSSAEMRLAIVVVIEAIPLILALIVIIIILLIVMRRKNGMCMYNFMGLWMLLKALRLVYS